MPRTRPKRSRSLVRDDWVQSCQLFVATEEERFAKEASARCDDDRICSVMQINLLEDHNPDGVVGALIALVQRLLEEGREREADMLRIAWYRLVTVVIHRAAERDERRELDENMEELRRAAPVPGQPGMLRIDTAETAARADKAQKTAGRLCSSLVAMCRRWEFRECEAVFSLALGVHHRAAHQVAEADALLARAVTLFESIDETHRSLFQRGTALALQHRGELLMEARQFALARDLFRRGERLLNPLADHPLVLPLYARMASHVGRALLAMRKFTAAADKLASVWDVQQKLALEHREELAVDMARTGLALSAALLSASSSRATLQRARRVAEETRATITRVISESPVRIYGELRGDAYCNLGWAFCRLGMFKKAKSELENAEVDYFWMRHKEVLYGRKMAVLHQRRAYAYSGERRYDKAVEQLELARGFLEAQPSELAQQVRLDYASVLDDLAAAHLARSDRESCHDLASVAVWEAESSCRHHSTKGSEGERAANRRGRTRERDRSMRIEDDELTSRRDDPGLFHLAKGTVARSYSYMAEHALTRLGGGEGLFRILAAQREGPAFVTFVNPGEETRPMAGGPSVARSLETAAETLRGIESRTARAIRIVIAQGIGGEDAMFGILGPDAPYLACALVPHARRAMSALPGELARVFRGRETTPHEWRERIGAAGERAWSALPDAVRDVLRPESGADVLISADPYWTSYPWEGLCSPDRRFLGAHAPLTRWTPISSESLEQLAPAVFGGGSRGVAILSPWDVRGHPPLPAARREARTLAARFRAGRFDASPEHVLVGKRATSGALIECLSAAVAVVHYAGHGVVKDAEERLVLHPDDAQSSHGYFARTEVERASEDRDGQGPLLGSHPLVTLSACLAGRVRAFGGQREDLVSALLTEGALAVIASAQPLFDAVAAPFGVSLYARKTQRPEGMAWTFADVRAELERAHRDDACWPSWLFLTYHGNPYATLPAIGRRRTTPGRARRGR